MNFGKDQNTGSSTDPIAAGVEEISSSLFGDSVTETSPGSELEKDDADPVGEQGDDPVAAETAGSDDPAPQDSAAEVGDPAVEGSVDTTAAPKTWKKEAAAEWANLPPAVQAEIHRREADIFKGIEQYRNDAQVGQAYSKVLQPYRAELDASGLDPVQMVNAFAYNHYVLSKGTPEQKLAVAKNLMTHYGIDLGQLGGSAVPAAEITAEDYVDPEIKALRDKISQLEGSFTERETAARRTEAQKMVDAFAADPANIYFEEVSSEVAQLLQAGAAKDLKDAYEKAIYLNPATRAKELQRLQTEAAEKVKREREEKVAKAKAAAATNVIPGQTSRSPTAPVGSLDDTLNATMANIKARS